MKEDPSQKFNLILTLGELSQILQGLQYIAYGSAAPIIESLQKQVAEQVTAAKTAEEAAKKAAEETPTGE